VRGGAWFDCPGCDLEELIVASDALLHQGNLVRIEGRFSPSTYQIRTPQRQGAGAAQGKQRPDEVAQALEHTHTNIEASNAELRAQTERYPQAVQALQERNRERAAEGTGAAAAECACAVAT
jgi:hypothetical protein